MTSIYSGMLIVFLPRSEVVSEDTDNGGGH